MTIDMELVRHDMGFLFDSVRDLSLKYEGSASNDTNSDTDHRYDERRTTVMVILVFCSEILGVPTAQNHSLTRMRTDYAIVTYAE